MTPKHFCILLLALVAAAGVVCQSDDNLFEPDNQFPPANPSTSQDGDLPEGSGEEPGIEPPATETTLESVPDESQLTTFPESEVNQTTVQESPESPVAETTPSAFTDELQTTVQSENEDSAIPEGLTTVTESTENAVNETIPVSNEVLTTVQSEQSEVLNITAQESPENSPMETTPVLISDDIQTTSQPETLETDTAIIEEPAISETKTDDLQATVFQAAVEEPINNETKSAVEGDGEEKLETSQKPQLEDVESTVAQSVVVSTENTTCPSPCMCHYSGTDDFVTDCAGYQLTTLPSPLNPITTILNIKNNKITEISKEISVLSKLKELDAENNLIMDLALGSVSNLPELAVLKLKNNRLITYPQDLKNSLSLTKLEEIDLGGNDIRDLKPETLSNLESLRKLTLPTSNPEVLQELCDSSRKSLETLCIESCEKNVYDCAETKIDGLDAALPGTLTLPEEGDNNDPSINNDVSTDAKGPLSGDTVGSDDTAAPVNDNNVPSGRSLANIVPEETNVQKLNSLVVVQPEDTLLNETAVKIGAATTDTNSGGGIDKSVIGMVVAGMVVIVAAITIKKNWSSIRKSFSSSPRPTERGHANGVTSPEEVPLQDKDKSPV